MHTSVGNGSQIFFFLDSGLITFPFIGMFFLFVCLLFLIIQKALFRHGGMHQLLRGISLLEDYFLNHQMIQKLKHMGQGKFNHISSNIPHLPVGLQYVKAQQVEMNIN